MSRLEKIKDNYLAGVHSLFGKPWVSMPEEDHDWLILQAERVQTLEEQVKRHKKEKYECMKKKQQYKQALEFYADESNHTEHRGTRIFGDVFYDKGEKARQALGGNENE